MVAEREAPQPDDPGVKAPAPAESSDKASDERVVAMFRALGYVLSARMLLLLAILGAFVLAILAALHETQASLSVLIAWCLLTIGPIVALEWKRRSD